jgi:hypothetical protein
MSATEIPAPPARVAFRHAVHCALLAVPLWLGLMHLPAPASIEIFDARPMALDYAVRSGLGLGTTLPSDTGPLGALLTVIHSGQPLWVNFWCQVLVGAALALGLSWAVWRLNSPLRWWVLGGLLVMAGFRAEYMHATSILLFGLMLLTQPIGRLEAVGGGLLLGVLGLINVQLALLGGLIVVLGRANPWPGTARNIAFFTGGSLLAAFVIGWVWTGQPAGELLPWLGHGVMPASLRYQAATWSGLTLTWGLLAFAAVGVVLVVTVIAATSRRREAIPAAFVFCVLFLAWRRATGQPDAQPQLFLITAFMAALLWIALKLSPAPRRWLPAMAAGGAFAAAAGLLVVEPRILTESIILLNRKMVTNVAAMANRPAWQRTLNDSFRSSAELFALPRIKAATAGKRTDLLGNATAYALVNRFNYAPRPGLQSYRVGDPGLAARDAAYYAGPGAPDFVVQRLQAFDRGLPALEDAPAPRALYAGYDFQFEENGFVLWKRRPGASATAALGEPVWTTQAAWDQPVALPLQPGRAYWLAIGVSRSPLGWLKRQLLFPSDPILLLHDSEGGSLSYRAAPENLATGFLVTPLFRGEIDLIRHQAGEAAAVIREVTVQKPADAPGDFSGMVDIALHEVSAPAVSGHRESAEAFAQRFRIADRLPVAVTAYYPPQTTQIGSQDVLLAHPDSSLEFPLRAGDASLQGRFGLLEGAYQNGNATDGVEFVVEHVPARGAPVVLWRRYLDPVGQPGDRGVQSFTVALPQPALGRVILRTQNLPGRNAAWDWSLWTDLRFAPPPATK